MKEVLSVFTFGIGALCFVVFVTVFKPTAVSAVHGTSKPEYLTARPLATNRTSFRIRNDRSTMQRTQSNSNEKTAQSTNPIDILPLITTWEQVRVPGAKSITYRIFILPAVGSPHQKRLASLLVAILQQSANYRSTLALAIVSQPAL
jgi:hypothetical protein